MKKSHKFTKLQIICVGLIFVLLILAEILQAVAETSYETYIISDLKCVAVHDSNPPSHCYLAVLSSKNGETLTFPFSQKDWQSFSRGDEIKLKVKTKILFDGRKFSQSKYYYKGKRIYQYKGQVS